MNISINERVSALEQKLLIDVTSVKDTASEALSLAKLKWEV